MNNSNIMVYLYKNKKKIISKFEKINIYGINCNYAIGE